MTSGPSSAPQALRLTGVQNEPLPPREVEERGKDGRRGDSPHVETQTQSVKGTSVKIQPASAGASPSTLSGLKVTLMVKVL